MSGPYDQSPLDKVTLDKTSVDTSASAINPTADENPRFQFSRELKILLGVLALGAAVAGWYVLSGAGTPADTATATVPPATTTPVQNGTGQPATGQAGTGQAGTGQTTPVTPGTVTPGTVTPGTEVVPGVTAGTGSAAAAGSSGTTGTAQAPSVTGGTSGGPVSVAQVPFLNPQGSQGQDPAGGAASTPVGINPEDPLAAVPTSNPFQPLTVVNTNPAVGTGAPQVASNTASGATGTSAQGGNNPTPTPNTNSGAGSSGTTLPVAGAVPLPNVPIAGISSGGTNFGRAGSNAGTGSNASTGSNVGAGSNAGTGSSGAISLGSGGAVPLPTVAIGGLPTTGSGTSTSPSTAVTTLPAAPVQPPPGTITPGLNTPNLSSLPLGTLTAGNGTGIGTLGTGTSGSGTSGSGTPGNGALGTGAVGDPSALTAASIQPGLISQYGSANAPTVPETPVVSVLDQLVQSRNLVFNAVVLGPINTAIFKTAQGFVVVPTGQNLPDSTVILKEVTATSVTLSLGDDSKILELDKR